LLALRHAELVLLVNNHQTKIVRRKPCLNQRVRADGEGRTLLDAGCRMLDAGCRMLDAGCRMLDAGCWILDTGYLILDT
jgi:hypothetical protein